MSFSKIDKPFFIIVILLAVVGFFVFMSASMGLLARNSGAEFSSVFFNQAVFGLIGGLIIFLITSKINYKFWRKHAFGIFVFAVVLMLLVFVPWIGFEHGGARRWLDLGITTFQPAEFLKFAFIVYFSAWLSSRKTNPHKITQGLIPFLLLLALSGGMLLLQPDTDTFVMLGITGLAIFFIAGARWRDIGLVILIALIGLSAVIVARPYLMDRVTTFLNPSEDSLGSGYQIQQSLIAIGSGGITGRGFGQSIQKFNYLPEPIGDSVFAVMAEEFGLIGSLGIVFLFLSFAYRGMYIAIKAPDSFSRLMTVGIVILITVQSLANMGAMLGLIPLTGMPLLFVSHGGTALFITLAEVGIIVNISKYLKTKTL